jgi:cytochrome c biogenesis protein CcmG/thiol:disulfide interchange protein DsbE
MMLRVGLPLAFLALVVLLGVGLGLNPREVPSPLVGRPVPAFDLERLRHPGQRLTHEDLKGKVSLVNVWATWCEGCRAEHPLLVRIADDTGIPIYGINYKDAREPALAWLSRLGDPYTASGFDQAGKVGLDLGVYGLPETFVVGPDGRIAYKHIGPISAEDWEQRLAPVIRSLGDG